VERPQTAAAKSPQGIPSTWNNDKGYENLAEWVKGAAETAGRQEAWWWLTL